MPAPINALSHGEFLKADKNYEKAARAVNLVYVTDLTPGIIRLKKGKGFSYILEDTILRDKTQLLRIKKLTIPPAWTNVWICALENGHIQATGLDVLKRKQYRYHSLWTVIRGETKFHRLLEFGKLLPRLRAQLEIDLQSKTLTQEKVLATVISLMERTYIRIGNSNYEKLYGSHGLTTLKDKHVSITGDKIRFSFRGKKGIQHDITLKNKRLAKAVEQCRDIPGKELFQYYDDEGNRRPVESGMVNDYIRNAMGMDFSAKDFRTWAGSLHALDVLCELPETDEESERKKNVVAMLDFVSGKLGNSRAICKKYYVHPGLVRLYEENNFARYLNLANETDDDLEETGLTSSEKVLLQILKRRS
ncbi:MAG: DNA topoisomerase IB [Bacteroidota bacterium]|nr:DNA topoisomerase IB [Bacteroidota bacterium]